MSPDFGPKPTQKSFKMNDLLYCYATNRASFKYVTLNDLGKENVATIAMNSPS
jgi:hypothetical protein